MKKKKKLLYLSDFAHSKTGFGRAAKSLLSYLYNTNKFEIVHYACNVADGDPNLGRVPWKTVATIPTDPQTSAIANKDENSRRAANYGVFRIDKIINEVQPDIFLAVQDFWGVNFTIPKPWFNKIHSVIWTTLDSLPLFPEAVDRAKDIKNYWIWSDFATKEMHRLGHTHCQTMHGPLETKYFFKLEDKQKRVLRKIFQIEENAFVIGFTARNQLRKSFPNLFEGYVSWKQNCKVERPTYLLLHTHWGEGWDLPKLMKRYGVDEKEVLTTYICKECARYQVKQFSGQDLSCPFCGKQKSQVTCSTNCGVFEDQLNEVYNLMDVYCHPFTSGGQEIPVQEAKLAELVTLVTNYSCGEELCEEGSGSLALEWEKYIEGTGTDFIKANTKPSSITQRINEVYNWSPEKRAEIGKISRLWTIKNFSIEAIGPRIEQFLDSCEPTGYNFKEEESERKDPFAIISDITDNREWLTILYKDVLKMDVTQDDPGLLHWMDKLNQGVQRKAIENYFRHEAEKDNAKNHPLKIEEVLGDEGKDKRLLLVMRESIGDLFLATSLLESWKKSYPDHNIYFATNPEYFEVLDGNPYIYKLLPWAKEMEAENLMIGSGDHSGFFDVYCNLAIASQRILNYLSHNKVLLP